VSRSLVGSTPTLFRHARDRKRPEPRVSSGALGAQQQMARLLNRRVRVLQNLPIRSAADRMADNRELVIRQAENPAHQFGGTDEAGRHHTYGGHPLPFSRYRVVHTAR
jgi:hypothetical protein